MYSPTCAYFMIMCKKKRLCRGIYNFDTDVAYLLNNENLRNGIGLDIAEKELSKHDMNSNIVILNSCKFHSKFNKLFTRRLSKIKKYV